MKTGIRVTTTSLGGILSWVLILLLPAGTLHYWQAWVFIAVFTVATIVPTVYLSRANPAALQRRMRAGPRAEPRTSQKFIITASFLGLFATMVFSALDHRFGWSSVPVWLSLLGDLLVATGLGIAMLVIVQNSYAGATVTVEADQTLVSGGLYRFVRHPMYVGNVIMMIGIPWRSTRIGGCSSSSPAPSCSRCASSTKRSSSSTNCPGTANTPSACAIGWFPYTLVAGAPTVLARRRRHQARRTVLRINDFRNVGVEARFAVLDRARSRRPCPPRPHRRR